MFIVCLSLKKTPKVILLTKVFHIFVPILMLPSGAVLSFLYDSIFSIDISFCSIVSVLAPVLRT